MQKVDANTLQLDTSTFPPTVVCVPGKKKMACNLTRNMEGLKKHLKRRIHLNTVKCMEAEKLKKESVDQNNRKHDDIAEGILLQIETKYPNVFEVYNQGPRKFLHCQVCLGSVNRTPESPA